MSKLLFTTYTAKDGSYIDSFDLDDEIDEITTVGL